MERIAPDLEKAGVGVELKAAGRGPDYMPHFIDTVDSLLSIATLR
jgi:hypothetical protein